MAKILVGSYCLNVSSLEPNNMCRSLSYPILKERSLLLYSSKFTLGLFHGCQTKVGIVFVKTMIFDNHVSFCGFRSTILKTFYFCLLWLVISNLGSHSLQVYFLICMGNQLFLVKHAIVPAPLMDDLVVHTWRNLWFQPWLFIVTSYFSLTYWFIGYFNVDIF